MEEEIKRVISQWLEIDFFTIANKLNFIDKNKIADKKLIFDTIRCLDYITVKHDEEKVNIVIALVALMWTYSDKKAYELKNIIIKFLSRIGYPTSAIIVDRKYDKKECRFAPLNSWLDELIIGFNQLLNEVEVNGRAFMLTDFQKKIWEAMDNEQVIGISAPTSAGKSFVVLLKLLQKISKRNRDVVYIVPTLSLVNQVTEDFNNMLKELGIGNYKIANTFMQAEDLDINNIYVLTQEKALAAFANEEAAFSKPLILVADEIQNIERIKDDRDERSKILFDILMEFRYKENVEQIIIAGPRIEEIGELGTEIFGVDAENISTESSPVLNLTYSICRMGKQYYLKQYCSLTSEPICEQIDNPQMIFGYGKKKYDNNYLGYLSFIVDHIGENQQNIIFAPTAPTARKIACYLSENNKQCQKNEELIEYYSNTIHKNYSLCNTLKEGVAYHHGKLPAHVRRTLEKAIVKKEVMNVVCTTTLLQGVNMPAQNVIIRNPHLYLKKSDDAAELSNYEMANLRGRAGRLLKDFIGRTYVLDESAFSDTDGYEQMELFEDTTKELPSGYEEKFEEYKEEIEDLVVSDKPVDETMQKYGFLVSYIRQAVLRYGKDARNKLKNVGIKLTSKQVAAIILKLDNLTVPKEICIKNRYWDPYVLQKVYDTFVEQVPVTPFERGAKAKIDRMFKFMRETPETFVSCVDKWASEEFDDRIDGAIDTFEEWISKFDEREKELLAKMLLKFDYYSKGGISKIIRSLCTESIKKYGISNANSIISVVRKKDGKHNSSYDYWMLHRWVSGLSNEIYYDSVDDINEEYWENIRKVVYIDDCSGTGKQFVTFMKRQRKSYLDKEVILLVIEAIEEAKLYIKSELEKEGINIKIMAYTTKEKALKSLLEEEKKMFLDMSQKRGISLKYILGFEEAEALMAFYNNTPNDTLGLFWFTSKENNPIFPRKLEEKPQWKFDREEKIKRRRQQYEAKC